MTAWWLCVVYVLAQVTSAFCQITNVKAITIVNRHGDRYPRDSYPNDPNKGRFKEEELGQLLPVGCERMFKNGVRLRQMFPQLSDRNYTEVRSSVKSRCIESAHCLLAGIDGPSSSPITYDIATAETVETDPMLNHADVDCPERAYEIITGPFFKSLYEDYKALFDTVARGTGESYSINDTYMFFDLRIGSLVAQNLMGLEMPEWANEKFMKEAETALDFAFGLQSRLSIESALNGVFFREMLQKWQTGSSNHVPLYVYSTHDTTLGSFMTAVNAWIDKRPLYGEALIFILTNDHQIKVLYLHQDLSLSQHQPPGCKQDHCPLATFEKWVDKMPKDWRSECNRHSFSQVLSPKHN